MKRLLIAATALGLVLGGPASFAASTKSDQFHWQNDQDAYDFKAPMEVTCAEFLATSDVYQRHTVSYLEGQRSGMRGGLETDPINNDAIASGADVSSGTRGVDTGGASSISESGNSMANMASSGDPSSTAPGNNEAMNSGSAVSSGTRGVDEGSTSMSKSGSSSDSGVSSSGESAAAAEQNSAISSGASVSMGTRGVEKSGTEALTADDAQSTSGSRNTAAGMGGYRPVSVPGVITVCEASPDMKVSDVVDQMGN